MVKSIAKRAKSKSSSRIGWVAGITFCTVFFGFGCVIAWLFFFRPILHVIDARDWPQAACEIVSSHVKTHSSSDGNTYSVEITFTYEFNGAQHTADSYSFGTGSSSGRAGKQRVVDQYPAGTQTTCFVDPDDPTHAVINRDMTAGMWLGGFTLLFPLIGGGGLIGMAVLAAREKQRALATTGRLGPHGFAPTGSTPTPAAPKSDFLPDHDAHAGPVTLRPGLRRWGKVAFFIMFALFWNGIVGVFIGIMVNGFMTGDAQWILVFFLIPFELIGIGLIVAIVYQILAAFNPKPVLTVSTQAPRLGDTVHLGWQVRGAVRRIGKLSISLVGEEHATYTVGTDTRHDHAAFLEKEIFATSDRFQMRRGSLQFTVPADSMHSMKLRHNQIRWYLVVQGEIRRWPDIDDAHGIVVLPIERSRGAT